MPPMRPIVCMPTIVRARDGSKEARSSYDNP